MDWLERPTKKTLHLKEIVTIKSGLANVYCVYFDFCELFDSCFLSNLYFCQYNQFYVSLSISQLGIMRSLMYLCIWILYIVVMVKMLFKEK